MPQIKCTHCGHTNPPQLPSCQKCRTPLPRISFQDEPVRSADPNNDPEFRRGQIVASRYTVLDLIGRGGMACIYKVHDNTLKEDVALKTMLPQFTRDRTLVERFYNEAKIARQLTHPNIVRVHDIGMAGNVLYISMELLQGRSLRAILDRQPAGTRLPVKTALRIVDQLCAALDYAHNFTIHRDIKPENVMVQNDGTVKLMDFGISKLRADSSLTATSMVMGTPHYMSPEQLKDSRNVDVRTDIYSMGVLLYEILTGNIPTGIPKPASQIMKETPPDLDRVINTCMEPDPISRYQSIRELRDAIRVILEAVDSNTTAQPFAPTKPPVKPNAVSTSTLGVVAIVAIAIAAGWGVWRIDDRRQQLEARAAVAPLANASTVNPAQAEYAALSGWLNLAYAKAVEAAGEDAVAHDAVGAAREVQTSAETMANAGDVDGAVSRARHALTVYTGIATCPEGMVFIPPGVVVIEEIEYELDGFFIDAQPVSNGDYAAFVDRVQGGWDPFGFGAGYEDSPVTNVTFYDAQMFAASRMGRLPTYAEWLRAVEVYPEAMVSEVSNWTQSIHGGPPHYREDSNAVLNEFWFGAELVACDAYYEESSDGPVVRTSSFAMLYEDVDVVGIRCVQPVLLNSEVLETLR